MRAIMHVGKATRFTAKYFIRWNDDGRVVYQYIFTRKALIDILDKHKENINPYQMRLPFISPYDID